MKVLFSNMPWFIRRPIRTWVWWLRHGRIPVFVDYGVRAGSRWPHVSGECPSPRKPAGRRYLPNPFFMQYAAAYLKKATGANVVLRDSIARNESYASYFEYLRSQRFDYIVAETSKPSLAHDIKMFKKIRAVSPLSKLVVTGPVMAESAKEILEAVKPHAVIKGEYEKGSVRVVNGESGVLDFDFLTEKEMNAAPYPQMDDEVMLNYWDSNPYASQPLLEVLSSRGCPFKCIFCSWPVTMTGNDPNGEGKRMVRFYHKEYMRDYLQTMVKKYGYKCIYFDDDTFNLGDSHTLEMCEVMREIKVPWGAMCRADTISLSTWRVMKDSGCYHVKIGFESGSQEVLDKIINKGLDLKKAEAGYRAARDAGLKIHGTFSCGFPGETQAQMQQTLDLMERLNCDTYQYSKMTCQGGTVLDGMLE